MDGELNMNVMKENNGERLNFDEGDQDDRGELANLVIWFVMYRVYVG